MTYRIPHLAFAAASGLVMLISAPAAMAQGRSGGTYNLRATVPVACWVQPASQVIAATDAGGSVIEACNSPGGFTVSAFYRPLALNEKAHMIYDGSRLDLAKSGQQLLRMSSMATIRTIDYRFEEVDLETPLVLSLTIQPI